MQSTDNQLAELARGFFRGTLSNDEEQILFGFLQENEEQRICFDAMEQVWNATHIPSTTTEGEWRGVRCRVQGNSPIRMRSRKMYPRCRLVTAAVALVLVLLLVTYFFSNHHSGPEAYYTYVALLGGKAEVVLSDGSRVQLNAGSDLRYPASPDSDSRMVELNGEAYFEVAKHVGSRFTVNVKGYNVTVYRTRFNISAYDDNATVTTTLLEGSVQMNLDNKRVVMVPGKRVTLNQVSGELIKVKASIKANAWIHGNAEYESIILTNLIKVPSRRFSMSITIQSPSSRDERLVISLNNGEDLDDIMRGLQRIIPIRAVRQEENVQILERWCMFIPCDDYVNMNKKTYII